MGAKQYVVTENARTKLVGGDKCSSENTG